jgi:hypothetical protein
MTPKDRFAAIIYSFLLVVIVAGVVAYTCIEISR